MFDKCLHYKALKVVKGKLRARCVRHIIYSGGRSLNNSYFCSSSNYLQTEFPLKLLLVSSVLGMQVIRTGVVDLGNQHINGPLRQKVRSGLLGGYCRDGEPVWTFTRGQNGCEPLVC